MVCEGRGGCESEISTKGVMIRFAQNADRQQSTKWCELEIRQEFHMFLLSWNEQFVVLEA
jgi:hypothetical protein